MITQLATKGIVCDCADCHSVTQQFHHLTPLPLISSTARRISGHESVTHSLLLALTQQNHPFPSSKKKKSKENDSPSVSHLMPTTHMSSSLQNPTSHCTKPTASNPIRNTAAQMLHKATLLAVVTFIAAAVCVTSVAGSQALPFNLGGTASFITGRDDSCDYVYADTRIFGQSFSSLYICTNGLISLWASFTSGYSIPFPYNGQAFIAPLWADLDTRDSNYNGAGKIFYEAIPTASAFSPQYEEYIRASDPSGSLGSFTASRIYLATWDEVGLYPRITFPNNTFQAAIVTDETDYFVIFNYPEGGLNQLGTTFTTGINLGDGYNYINADFSRTNASRAVYESNIGYPGVWVWNVGNAFPTPSFTQSPPPTQSNTASAIPSQSPSLPANALVYRNIHGKSNKLGYSVSADGNEVAVSQPYCSENSQADIPCGKVYLLQTSSEGWSLKQYFQYLGKVAYSSFGAKVLLQSGWLIVQSEAPYDWNTGYEKSAVYGFHYSAAANRYVRKFAVSSPIDQSYQYYGSALATDGNFTFIASPYANTDGYTQNGVVFGYHYPKSIDRVNGPQYMTITSPYIQYYDVFGRAVAACGGILVVSSGSFYGAAHVFTYSLDSVNYVQTIYPSHSYSYYYGTALAFDGYNLFVTAPADAEYQYSSGSLYRYTLNQYGTFDEANYIIPYDTPYLAYFGTSLAYNKERQYLVVGASCDNCGVKGSIYVVQDSGFGYWYQTKYALGVQNGSDSFGRAVAANSNGIMIGAPYDHVSGDNRGALYLIAY